MSSKRKFVPSPAMIVACLALLLAIGGSAYAASKINGKQIKQNTVTGKQIKESTLKGVKKAKKAKDANKLKGEKPDAFKSRWLLIGGNGQILEQTGGFKILDAYQTNANVYIDAGESVEGHGLTATIAIVNKGDLYSPTGVTDTNFRERSASAAARPRSSSALRRTRRTRARSWSRLATATGRPPRPTPARRSTSS